VKAGVNMKKFYAFIVMAGLGLVMTGCGETAPTPPAPKPPTDVVKPADKPSDDMPADKKEGDTAAPAPEGDKAAPAPEGDKAAPAPEGDKAAPEGDK
jgi:hypothetical protein